MENKRLTWDEIRAEFDQEWVLLDDCDWPEENIDPKAGLVRFHSKDRTEFDRLLSTLAPGFDSAIVFVGPPKRTSDVVTTRGYSRVVFGK